MFSEFKKIVLEELTTLNLKVNSLIDTCANAVQLLRSSKELPNLDITSDTGEYAKILQMLPLKNESDIGKLEVLLANKNNYQMLVSISIMLITVLIINHIVFSHAKE